MIRKPVRARRKASTIVEAAFVLPIFLLLLFGAFEYCRFVFLLQVAESAAREGARYAVTHTGDGTTLQNVKDYTTAQLHGRHSELGPSFQVEVYNANPSTGAAISGSNWNDAPFGGAILVRVSGTYTPILPGFLKTAASINVRATAMMSSEAN